MSSHMEPPLGTTPVFGQESYVSGTTSTATTTTTTTSTTTTTTTSSSSSSRASTPTRPRNNEAFTAPTPYNTFLTSQVDPETYSFAATPPPRSGNYLDNDSTFDPLSPDQEYIYEGGIQSHEGDLSLRPSLSPSLSTASTPSRGASYYSSSASARLLPIPSPSPAYGHGPGPESPPSVFSKDVPHSARPIPAPLQNIRFSPSHGTSLVASSSNANASTSQPDTALQTLDPSGSSVLSSATGHDIEISASTNSTSTWSRNWTGWDRKGKGKAKQDDVDAHRLQQLGYDAVLGRDYNFWSSLSISTLNIGLLQGTIYAVKNAYSYGGPSMILVAWPVSGCFSIFLVLTLSEFASTFPVTGAMASWGWKLARGGVGGERGWGWVLGGFVLGGHAASAILVTWEICDIIAGTMNISFQYQIRGWHEMMFFIAAMLLLGVVGMTAWGRSHRFWLSAGVFGFAMWLALCVTLIVTEVSRSGRIRTDLFFNHSGWESKPYVYLLGWQYSTIASGYDASAHMAEETKNPSRNVPNAMVMSMVISYVLGYISIILLLLSISPEDGESVSNHPFAFGYILSKAISPTASIAICSLVVIVLLLQVLAQLQASSRFIFALARDNAIPFSEAIRRTNSSRQPVTAHWVAIGLCLPFAALLLGGKGYLFSLLAVTAGSLSYAGYVTPAILYLLSGKDLQTEGRTSWSLRRWSKPIACVGVAYGMTVIVVQALPGQFPVTSRNISWSPVVLAGTIAICYVTWKCYGNTHYSGPIRALTKWQTGVEIDIQSTLGPRSRPSANGMNGSGPSPGAGAGNIDPFEVGSGGVAGEDDSKFGVSPYLESAVGGGPLVTVTSAGSVEHLGRARGQDWTDVISTTTGGVRRRTSANGASGMGMSLGESTDNSESGESSGSQNSSSTVTRQAGV